MLETKQTYFITGTDTNIGKTYVTLKLMEYFKRHQYSVLGLKPLASGCIYTNNKWVNEDALALQQAASMCVKYDIINPIALAEPLSPHIAALRMNQYITVHHIIQKLQAGLQIKTDIKFIEGAGGWFTPINQTETIADLAMALNYPIILVVPIQLGCINHAILTYEAIRKTRLTFKGWIANLIEPVRTDTEEIIAYLQKIPSYLGTNLLR